MSSMRTSSAFLADAAARHASASSFASASDSARTASLVEAMPRPTGASSFARFEAAAGRRNRGAVLVIFDFAGFAGFVALAAVAARRTGLRRVGIALHHLIVQ